MRFTSTSDDWFARASLYYLRVVYQLLFLMFLLLMCFDPSGCENCEVCALFHCNIVSVSPGIDFWNSRVNNLCWKKSLDSPTKIVFWSIKLKKFHLKSFICVTWLDLFFVKFKNYIDLNCAFCFSHTETVVHLF